MKKTILALCLIPTAVMASDDCLSRKTLPDGELTLQQIIELGLCRNPQTSAAYLSSEVARLNKNAGYAGYLPSVNASVSSTKSYQNNEWGDWSNGASLSASYLIFDFGKRLSDLNNLAATWRATGFDYDESVQNYVYGVIGSYYALLNANADIKTAQSLKTVAQTAKDTADKKFKAGVVAKADVLKADTTLATRNLEMERAKNNREIAKGNLLSKLSFSADQDIKISDMPSNFGKSAENKSIDELIALAEKSRPDLLSATANREAAWHRRNSAFLKNLPSISASGSMSYNPSPDTFSGNERVSGSIGIRASMPIFAGFANVYGARSAMASYERAKEQERATSDAASLDIFTAYQNYKTAQTVLTQTETLLKSATESERVTGGMYKVGRATMLDWQTVQADLANAQKENNAAKYDLFTKRAALALAIGEIKLELSGGEK
ncbi:MAG: TolC family protein [Alphaproteobacteria bacterium]|nr:TolC family protein [Alphaproteobacteria bacterium]MBN2675327.1 TolC family protein [Alphaproteobacteria bacterium]